MSLPDSASHFPAAVPADDYDIVATHTDAKEVLVWNMDKQPNRTEKAEKAGGKGKPEMSVPDLYLTGHTANCSLAALASSKQAPAVASGGQDNLVCFWSLEDAGAGRCGERAQALFCERDEAGNRRRADALHAPPAGTSLAADGEGKGRKSWNSGGSGGGAAGGNKLACRRGSHGSPLSHTPRPTHPRTPTQPPPAPLTPTPARRRVALEGHTQAVEDVAFHPLSAKARLLPRRQDVSTESGGGARPRAERRAPCTHGARGPCPAPGPQGEELCSVGDDSALLFWDVRQGKAPVIKARGAACTSGMRAAGGGRAGR